MKSKVVALWDHAQAQIPEEYRCWRVTDVEIQKKLESLSKIHTQGQEDVGTVQMGDSVACQGESQAQRWNRSPLLFYPGRGILDAYLETAMVGAKLGESRIVDTQDGPVKLTVIRIVRSKASEINDALVQKENIEGVTTLADYADWYRKTTEEPRFERNHYSACQWLLEQIIANSQVELDEAEALEFCGEIADKNSIKLLDPSAASYVSYSLGEQYVGASQATIRQALLEKELKSYPSHVVHNHLAYQLMEEAEVQKRYHEAIERIQQRNGWTPEQMQQEVGVNEPCKHTMAYIASESLGSFVKDQMED